MLCSNCFTTDGFCWYLKSIQVMANYYFRYFSVCPLNIFSHSHYIGACCSVRVSSKCSMLYWSYLQCHWVTIQDFVNCYSFSLFPADNEGMAIEWKKLRGERERERESHDGRLRPLFPCLGWCPCPCQGWLVDWLWHGHHEPHHVLHDCLPLLEIALLQTQEP